jgi:N-acetylated-alpha-linked acidic dipeptidase
LQDYLKNYSVQALGSGSDFTPFLQHLGIASGQFGFRRGKDDPVYHYHSHFDSEYWMERYGSPEFKRHVAVAQALGLATVQAASARILPINTTDYAREILSYSQHVRQLANDSGFDHLNFDSLDNQIEDLVEAARSLDTSLTPAQANCHTFRTYNRKVKLFEGQFIQADGLDGRPWYQNRCVSNSHSRLKLTVAQCWWHLADI